MFTSRNMESQVVLWRLSLFLCPIADDGKHFWDNPSSVGHYDDSCKCFRGPSRGWRNFVKHFDLRRRNYLKNDDLIIFIDFEGSLFVFGRMWNILCSKIWLKKWSFWRWAGCKHVKRLFFLHRHNIAGEDRSTHRAKSVRPHQVLHSSLLQVRH